MNSLGSAGPLIASTVALVIAGLGWYIQSRRDRNAKDERLRRDQADLLAELLELCVAAGDELTGRDAAKAKAILIRLPGHLATILRPALKLKHTMHGPLDKATVARLRPSDKDSPGYKWLIFDRSSAIKGRSFAARPEWVEAEIAYDIAGLLGGDQDAVLAALEKDVRDMDTLIRVVYQRTRGQKKEDV